ncbi:MAG: COG1615 family transporter, partial [Pseudanabaena sp. SU_2_4]|nr:COG1615 family transporter [Pseudanabaena sp. SU_2_4]
MKLQLAKPATWQRYTLLLLLPLGLWLAIEVVARLGAEILWFQEVGYLSVYLSRLFAQAGLWVVTFAIAVLYLLGNLALAQQLKHPDPPPAKKVALFAPSSEIDPDRLKYSMPLRGRWLISLGLGLSLIVGLLLLHYVQVAVAQVFLPSNLANISPLAPLPLRLGAIWQLIQQLVSTRWLGIAFLGGAIALLIYPRFLLTAISLAISAAISTAISRQWTRILPYFQPTQFGNDDPVFGLDISFYIFSLPVWQLLEFALVSLFLYGFVAVALTYLLSANSLSQGLFPGWSRRQQRHLYGLGGCLMLGVAFSYWVSRYELLYSPRGVSYGASYTDINVQLPAYTLLAILAVAIAAYLLWRSLLWPRQISNRPFARKSLGFGLGLYLVMAVVAGAIAPLAVQSLVVQPNELENERPYIERTIAMTRQAFGLEEIEVKPFDPQNRLTYADIQANDLTIRNIRLWDRQPLLDTNRQLQQIRPYYRFADADIDRYTLVSEPQKPPAKQQVLIAARELDYSAVPKQAQTWVNRSLIYTHGYGFTLSPVNKFDASGLPEYFVKDIGITEGTPLTTSSESIRNRIPIGQPRIYYGELTNTYVMTNTKVKELDYPSGADNAYNTYDGRGGINIGSLWQRWMFAKYLNDWRMVFTKDLLPQSKLLFRRNINRRMRAIAPFLQFDSDPYLVAADAQIDQNNQNTNDPSYLYWIVDAYTTSDRYPYADVGNEGINYIRNSVKVVIDAYHGSVNFYIANPQDPIIQTWAAIFPNLFKPLSEMPANLRPHLRYPVDFFKIQSERLMTYHMTDPQVFYNREDQWQIPTEVYGDRLQLVEPYYLITSLPTVPFEEFILLLPYTPKERTNLTAWLAARSDRDNYGKLLLYVFPKQRLVYGTQQIEARINQDPTISQQISLWNRQGSKTIQGNLLVIPLEKSLLYV